MAEMGKLKIPPGELSMLREFGSLLDKISQLADLITICMGYYFTLEIYRYKQVIARDGWEQYFLIFLLFMLCWIISSSIYGVYQSRRFMSWVNECIKLIKTHAFTFFITVTSVILYEPTMIHNRFVFYFEAIALSITLLLHIFVRVMLQFWRSLGKNTKYVLIIGSGQAAHTYLDKVDNNPQLGIKVVGYLSPLENALGVPYLGNYSNLENVIKAKIIDVTVITSSISDSSIKDCMDILDEMGKAVTILLDETVAKVARSRPIDFDGLPMVAYDSTPRIPSHELIKRTMDILVSTAGLIITSPLMLIIAISVKLTSNGPVFFKQERVGLNGRRFKMLKFRSMVVNAEELKDKFAHLNEMSGPVFKISNDPRVTRLGAFLRKTSLDELPQLWNVLMNDMSLVGPRPQLPNEVNMYNPKHRKRLAMKPGITCIWQISGRNEVDFDEWMKMDVDYIENWTLTKDIQILLKTVPAVLLRKGAS